MLHYPISFINTSTHKMNTPTQATHDQITDHTLNSLSLIEALQVTGQDLSEGFLLEHTDILNLLSQVKQNLEQINSLNLLASKPF